MAVCALSGLGDGCVGCERWACWHKGMFLFLLSYVFTRGGQLCLFMCDTNWLRHCATTVDTCTSVTGICLPGQRTCTRAIYVRPITGRGRRIDGGNFIPIGIAACVIENGEFQGLGKAGYGSVQALMLRAVRCAWVEVSNPRDPLGQMYYGSLKYGVGRTARNAIVSTLIA